MVLLQDCNFETMFRLSLTCVVLALAAADNFDILRGIQEGVDYVKNYDWSKHPDVGQVCYGELGCFGKCLSHVPAKPQSPAQIDTRFLIVTKTDRYRKESNVKYAEQMKLEMVPEGASVVMVAHGWTENGHDALMKQFRNAAEAHYDVVITVDWGKGAGQLYQVSVADTEVVGRQMALLADRLVKQRNVPKDKIHIYGFSLGGQVVGFAGEYAKTKYGITFDRVFRKYLIQKSEHSC